MTNGTATTRLVNVGYGNVVVADHIVAIVALDSLPVKRLIEGAKGSSKLVDATNGRRTRAVVVTTSDHLVLSSLEPATLAQRLVGDIAADVKPRGRGKAQPRREPATAAAQP